jgi:hypothetical protein
MKTTAIDVLTELLHKLGKIPSIRVSSAQEEGGHSAHWGAVRCELRLNKLGQPSNYALEAADSYRRSLALAWQDAEEFAKRERRVLCQGIGRLREQSAADVLRQWSQNDQARAAVINLRAIPPWTDRCLVKTDLKANYVLASGVLTAEGIAAVEPTNCGSLRNASSEPHA